MWNRVILLTAGMAYGWGLANYLTCAPDDRVKHMYRMRLSMIVALALTVWIGIEHWPSGLIAFAVFLFSAVVAYAGRARQATSVHEPVLPASQRGALLPGTRAVIIVAHVPPENYTGPDHWAACLDYLERTGTPIRSWFTRPLAYLRIRQAYQAMPAPPAARQALLSLQGTLHEALGSDVTIAFAHPVAPPYLAEQLFDLNERGTAIIGVVPIDLEADHALHLSRQIILAHMQQAGAQVRVLDNVKMNTWGADRCRKDTIAWMQGNPASESAPLSPSSVDALIVALQEALPEPPEALNPGD